MQQRSLQCRCFSTIQMLRLYKVGGTIFLLFYTMNVIFNIWLNFFFLNNSDYFKYKIIFYRINNS